MSEHIGRQARRQAIAQWVFVGCGLAGIIVGAGSAAIRDLEILLPRAFLVGASLVGIAALLGASILYWRNIDEAAREAHKFAWFWGGTVAMMPMLAFGVFVSPERLVVMFGERSPAEWVAGGMGALLIAQMIGYGLVWAVWWLRQR